MKKIRRFGVGVFLSFLLFTAPVHAASFTGNGSLGRFSGSFTYTVINMVMATLHFIIDNISPAANGGYLTAIAFNNPGNKITGVSLSSSNSNFGVLGGTSFDNGINGQPMGLFDIGASTGGSWEGGGNPSRGIAAGGSAMFDFNLSGNSLNTLNENSFMNELSSPQGNHAGQFFAARFRGFNNDGSDKVPGTVTPEPVSSALFLLGGAVLWVGAGFKVRGPALPGDGA